MNPKPKIFLVQMGETVLSLTRYKVNDLTSLKGFSASKCDVGNWIFSKLGTFWEIFWIFFWIFFWRFFFEDLLGSDLWVQPPHPQCGGHYGEAEPRQMQKLQLSKIKPRLKRKILNFENKKSVFYLFLHVSKSLLFFPILNSNCVNSLYMTW